MKKVLLILPALFIIIALLITYYNFSEVRPPYAKVDNQIFRLEISRTEKAQEIGLAEYKSIPNDFGMLFPFQKPGYYAFWMKNMKFPIDIIYIRDNKIVTIFKNVPAPKSSDEKLLIYQPSAPADTVLEINAGLSGKYGFKNNDSVILNY